MRKSLWIIALLFAVLPVRSAFADTVYTYTGNPYNACSGAYCIGGPYHLSITFETSLTGAQLDNLVFDTDYGPGPPTTGDIAPDIVSLSIGDGLAGTLTLTSLTQFTIGTDASGNIIAWQIFVGGTALDYESCNYPPIFNWCAATFPHPALDLSELLVSQSPSEQIFGIFKGSPGTWTPPSQITEPSSIALVLLGVGLLFVMQKRAE